MPTDKEKQAASRAPSPGTSTHPDDSAASPAQSPAKAAFPKSEN